MGLGSWIKTKIFRNFAKTKEIRKSFSDEIKQEFRGFLKKEILDVLQDEEIGSSVVEYGDTLYKRYRSKFWGEIGGLQKNLNFLQNQGQIDTNSILMKALDGEEISLSSIIKGFLLSGKQNSEKIDRVGVMS